MGQCSCAYVPTRHIRFSKGQKDGTPPFLVPELSQENPLPYLGRCNFPNKADEVYQCKPPSRAGAQFRPHIRRAASRGRVFAYRRRRPIVSNERNQARGLGTDKHRDALLNDPLLPPPMSNDMKNFGAYNRNRYRFRFCVYMCFGEVCSRRLADYRGNPFLATLGFQRL